AISSSRWARRSSGSKPLRRASSSSLVSRQEDSPQESGSRPPQTKTAAFQVSLATHTHSLEAGRELPASCSLCNEHECDLSFEKLALPLRPSLERLILASWRNECRRG